MGLGKDPKEVEERVEPSILGAGSSCPVIECCRLTYPTVCGIAENQHGTPALPGAVKADFAPLSGAGRWFGLKWRLKNGQIHENGAPTHLPELR